MLKQGVASQTNFRTESSIELSMTISELWQLCICIENRVIGKKDKNAIKRSGRCTARAEPVEASEVEVRLIILKPQMKR